MNARSCQLCGKPLSRLRVGGDGDFCSKEHRNQHRLRAGMDRLVEVNKVASLMRRRENTRMFPAASLILKGPKERRGFGILISAAIHAAPRLLSTRPGKKPRVSYRGDQLMIGKPSAAAPLPLPAREFSGGAFLAARPGALHPPARKYRLPAAIPIADMAVVAWIPANLPATARHASVPCTTPGRAFIGELLVMRQWKRGAHLAATRPRVTQSEPVRGVALRVSTSMRFRLTGAVAPRSNRILEFGAIPSAAGIKEIDRIQRSTQRSPISLSLQVAATAMGIPVAPAVPTPGFEPSQTVPLRQTMLRDMAEAPPRREDVPLGTFEPALPSREFTQAGIGFLELNRGRFFPLAAGLPTPGLPQLEFAPFVPSEDYCVPQVEYCNVLASAVSTEEPRSDEDFAPALMPVPVPAPPRQVRFEENFDSGWTNWDGGVADWKVDVAGVRTGSLALFLPTMELTDYDLEFLARIDTRSITWLVRASSASTYMRCRLTLVEGSQLEFSRAVVRDGAADAPQVSAMRLPLKPRSSFTVKMSVTGPVFSISVDGKIAESWVDDRLPSGGIGFAGSSEDRTRLYWVRVTSPPAPDKEHIQ
jgi:hypothetical protein